MVGRGIRLGFGVLALAGARPKRKGTWTKARPLPNFTHRPARLATNRRKAFPRRIGFSGSKAFYASITPLAVNQPPFSPPSSKADSQLGRVARHTSRAKSSETTPSGSDQDIPRPPADIPDVKQ